MVASKLNGSLRRVVLACGGIWGSPRALLLQIAHPQVALGVEQHSNFRESPFPRLLSTASLLLALLFGGARRPRVYECVRRAKPPPSRTLLCYTYIAPPPTAHAPCLLCRQMMRRRKRQFRGCIDGIVQSGARAARPALTTPRRLPPTRPTTRSSSAGCGRLWSTRSMLCTRRLSGP